MWDTFQRISGLPPHGREFHPGDTYARVPPLSVNFGTRHGRVRWRAHLRKAGGGMAGVSWDLLISVMFFLVSIWGAGRAFRMANLPSILGEFLAGVFLGPNFLDIVPFSSNGRCDTIIFPHEEVASNLSTGSTGSTGCDEDHGRMLAAASGPQCMSNLLWTPRWSMEGKEGIEIHTPDIWSFAGTVGVTLLIMESGMHINFAKVRQIGGQALIVRSWARRRRSSSECCSRPHSLGRTTCASPAPQTAPSAPPELILRNCGPRLLLAASPPGTPTASPRVARWRRRRWASPSSC